MCRNIKTLFNFEQPASEPEIRAASLQFVLELSGFNVLSKANEAGFELAVQEVGVTARVLMKSLVINAARRNRDVEAEKARIASIARFGGSGGK